MNTVRTALLCSRLRVEEKLLRDALVRCGADVDIVDDRDPVFALDRPQRGWDVVVQRCVSQTRGLAALQVLESWDVRTVNTAAVTQLCNDKLATTAALRRFGLPVPRTVIAFSEDAALRAAEELGYPVVLKPLAGSWGRLLARINDRDAAEAIFEHRAQLGHAQHSVFYLQEHIAKPQRDIRAFVIDGETICAIYREAEHWITNTARGARASNCPVTPEIARLCARVSHAVGGGALAVDLLEAPDRLLVSEVNATMEFRNSIDVTGVDIPGHLARFVIEAAQHGVTFAEAAS